MQLPYFLNVHVFNLLFYCHIIKRNWLLMKNLAIILPPKSKLSRKFQCFNTIAGSIEILKKKLNFGPKQRAAFRKLFCLYQPPTPPDKILLDLSSKNFLIEIYRNTQTFTFKVLQESSSWASGNGAVQTETYLLENL